MQASIVFILLTGVFAAVAEFPLRRRLRLRPPANRSAS